MLTAGITLWQNRGSLVERGDPWMARILMVDDETDILALNKRRLEAQGYERVARDALKRGIAVVSFSQLHLHLRFPAPHRGRSAVQAVR